jgi:hypothetical protein
VAVFICICIFALGGSLCSAQSSVPFTANLSRLTDGLPLDRTVFHLELADCGTGNIPRVIGSASHILAETSQDIAIDVSGDVAGNLWPNDLISCGNVDDVTRYLVSVMRDQKRIWGPAQFHVSAAALAAESKSSFAFDAESQDITYTPPAFLSPFGDGVKVVTTNLTTDPTGTCPIWLTGPVLGSTTCGSGEGGSSGYSILQLNGSPLTQRGTANFSTDFSVTDNAGASRTDIALNALPESKIASLISDLAGKSAVGHTHPESDIVNLISDLAGKAATNHTHAESDVINLVSDLASKLSSSSVSTTAGANKVPQADGSGHIDAAFLPSSINSSTSGNAGTATAFASNGSNCATGLFPKGVDASGDAEGCAALAGTDLPAPSATALGGVEAKSCSGTDKVSSIGTDGVPVCSADQTGAGGSGITSLNGLSDTVQTFSKVDDTNVTLAITSATANHQFALAWTGRLAKTRQSSTTAYTDQANTFGAFLQTFQAGNDFNFADPADATKLVKFDLSGLSTGVTRAVILPDADSETVPEGSADGQIPIWNFSSQRYAPGDPIVSGDQATATTQSIAGTGVGTAVGVTRHSMVLVTVHGTYAGVNIGFEASPDATTYFPVEAARVDSAAVETSSGSLTNVSRSWFVNVSGYTEFRLNTSAFGTGTVSATITPIFAPFDRAITAQIAGTPSVNVSQISGTAPDVNSGNKSAGTQRVVLATDQPQLTNALKVDGSGATQPVSASALPLPSGAATAAKQPALGTAGTPAADVVTVQGVASMTALKVDGSAVTQPISATALPLPSGAATAAKQPAIGTAGTPAADVVTVQGAASMTALKVDGSAVTQPISASAFPLPAGAATAAKQPALGTAGTPATDVVTVQGTPSMTALKVDGSAVTQPVSISGNQPVNQAQVAGTAVDVNSGNKSAGTQRMVIATDQPQLTNALKVDGSAVTQPISASALPLPSGAATAAKQPALGTAGTPSADVVTVQGAGSMTPILATDTPSATGGWTPIAETALSTTVQTVKSSAGTLGAYYCYNPNSTVAYVQVFDTSGTVTLGTTVAKWTMGIPPGAAANLGIPMGGLNFASAIKVATTTTATGSTANSTALNCNFGFK